MWAIKYAFLGAIQGLTEFLPVSSSAHLVIFQDILGVRQNQLLLDIILHLGTLLALIVFLFKDIRSLLKGKIPLYILSATLLTALIVILGQDFFEGMFASAKKIILPLALTGIILLATKRFNKGSRKIGKLRISDALWVGIVQGFSVIPGLSRSGITISTLLFRNVDGESAFKFSLLVSIPAILGAAIFKIGDFPNVSCIEYKYMIVGFFISFLSGLLALRVLLAVMRKARLHLFGYYCLALALILWRKLR